MNSNKSFHTIIFKNTGLFGLSQIIRIGVKLISNKVAAIFLGPMGIGIIGLLENIIGIIQSVTGLGIASSSVREIAIATEENNEKRLIKIIYQWAIITGVLGAIVLLIFSKYITYEVFESYDNLNWILLLSIYFVFSAVSSIRLAVLQAKKEVKTIVKYHIFSAITSALLAIILYYYLGKSGIIPFFIGSVFIQFLYSFYLTRNVEISTYKIPFKEVLNEGMPMVKLGIVMSVGAIIGQICFYSIRWYLKEEQSIEILGVYQVSNTILVGYLGLVFSAMSNDFYPRLCNYDNDLKKFNDLVNDQTEIALLVVVPGVLLLYLISPFLINLLYTKDFIPVLEIFVFGLFAIILKAVVWPIGFISLVKGNKWLYFKQNLLGDFVNVLASVFLFNEFGLKGIGIAMFLMFLISGIYNYYVAAKYYNFKFRRDTLEIITFSLILGTIVSTFGMYVGFSLTNPIIIILLLVSIVYSIFQLNKRLKFFK